MTYLWTTESVSAGHPDKVADVISDSILDYCLSGDPNSKVACETLIKGDKIVLAGEITSKSKIEDSRLFTVVKNTLLDIGYSTAESGFDVSNFTLLNMLSAQSPEINAAVEKDSGEIGAGDQGIMFGYASDSTSTFMPKGMHLSRLVLDAVGDLDFLYPDKKSQVTLECNGDETKVKSILLSVNHDKTVQDLKCLRHTLVDKICDHFHKNDIPFDDIEWIINPAGLWYVGGPIVDCGLTGRKIVVDNYGPDCQVGGGAFSGKDPSKVDRSAAYAARHIAQNIVRAGISSEAKIQLAYAIGVPEPVSLRVELTGIKSILVPYNHKKRNLEERVAGAIRKVWSLTPKSIIDRLNLTEPIYKDAAQFGHFGNKRMPWEQVDLEIQDALNGL
jgi:S-adenosylmethionine synthetase